MIKKKKKKEKQKEEEDEEQQQQNEYDRAYEESPLFQTLLHMAYL